MTVELAGRSRIETPVAGPAGEAPAAFLGLPAAEAPGFLAHGHARLRALAGNLATEGPGSADPALECKNLGKEAM